MSGRSSSRSPVRGRSSSQSSIGGGQQKLQEPRSASHSRVQSSIPIAEEPVVHEAPELHEIPSIPDPGIDTPVESRSRRESINPVLPAQPNNGSEQVAASVPTLPAQLSTLLEQVAPESGISVVPEKDNAETDKGDVETPLPNSNNVLTTLYLRSLSIAPIFGSAEFMRNNFADLRNKKYSEISPESRTNKFLKSLGCLLMVTCGPIIPAVLLIANDRFNGSILDAASFFGKFPVSSMKEIANNFTTVAPYCTFVYFGWMLVQAILSFVPDTVRYILNGYVGGKHEGAVTPDGHILKYKVNGLQTWLIIHALWVLNAFSPSYSFFSPSFLFRNQTSFLALATISGFVVSMLAFTKGHLYPSNPIERSFSGSMLRDFVAGVELNPRLGKHFDLKLFFNGRPGIIACTLMNSSAAFYQFEEHGKLSNSMVTLQILQCIYVVDFFWNERWYLKTLDICHDHFGFYLAWGKLAWLPFTYTLQAAYLARRPTQLSSSVNAGILLLGLVGYVISRSANSQKDHFKRDYMDCILWGKPADIIESSFVTSDGRQHDSPLLTSGWWGVTRHMNYTGHLIMTLACCMCCGTMHALPYFYFVFLTLLLVHRAARDEGRCRAKHGNTWDDYKKLVPHQLIPGLY